MKLSGSGWTAPIEGFAEVSDDPFAWQSEAACRNVAQDLGSVSIFWSHSREWRPYCAPCPTSWECLQFAIENNEQHGVYGGMTSARRERFVKKYGVDPTSRAAHREHLNEMSTLRKAIANDDRRVRVRQSR